MKFQVLSHAGLLVDHGNLQLLCDPWLIGSTYWRSWWNYPPVSRKLVNSLRPNVIYLTHIHWDHFQSASLKLFPRTTKVICPKGHFDRMRRDLNSIGFHDVTELNHGESFQLGPDFRLTSYSFDLLCDSAVMIETPKTTLLNLNDCKIMGWPLRHLLRRHNRPDFVFCSHSSANSRSCFEIIDHPDDRVDDESKYIERFYQFASATRARYAVPFASNQCYLHRDTFRFNSANRTPMMVKEYWEQQTIRSPELKVMVSGDSWSEETGFHFSGVDWFTDRGELLLEYQREQSRKLEDCYAKEERAQVPLSLMTRFFERLFKSVPFLIRRSFKNHPVVYVLHAGERRTIYQVDLYRRQIVELDDVNDADHPLQIHLPAYVMRHALAANILAHVGIGKRVRYRVTRREKKFAERLKALVDLHEYEVLPLTNLLSWRAISNWLRRWREVVLYVVLAKDKILSGKLKTSKHLVPPLPLPQGEPPTRPRNSRVEQPVRPNQTA